MRWAGRLRSGGVCPGLLVGSLRGRAPGRRGRFGPLFSWLSPDGLGWVEGLEGEKGNEGLKGVKGAKGVKGSRVSGFARDVLPDPGSGCRLFDGRQNEGYAPCDVVTCIRAYAVWDRKGRRVEGFEGSERCEGRGWVWCWSSESV